ncbi:MAG: hypothetical protein CM15mP111_3750 [Hyphomicrobiales bacterium]|nr:MAG: hypothetical protein CM15mP111_3750 [Hyphomicrobiales bacterium]
MGNSRKKQKINNNCNDRKKKNIENRTQIKISDGEFDVLVDGQYLVRFTEIRLRYVLKVLVVERQEPYESAGGISWLKNS